jgi:hypothetical protein
MVDTILMDQLSGYHLNAEEDFAYVIMSDDEKGLVSRREFLIGLKRWSLIVIGGVALGSALATQDTRSDWINGGGDAGWINRRY